MKSIILVKCKINFQNVRLTSIDIEISVILINVQKLPQNEEEAKMSNKKYDGKHLNISQRIIIEKGLCDNDSFLSIAQRIGKAPSTVSKEIRRHLMESVVSDKYVDIPCQHSKTCRIKGLCNPACSTPCRMCRKPFVYCKNICSEYTEKTCEKLNKPPYCCNGCTKKGSCKLRRKFYSAKYAQDTYIETLVSSREGINQAPVDIYMLDQLISPLLKKGQSLAHIYANHAAEIPCCRKTLYNYIDKGLFKAKNIDMRRRVRYKVRKNKTAVSFSAREFRIGRTYEDYQKCLKANPNVNVVQMDTVEGSKKEGSKALLTMLFCNCSLMLIFLLEDKTEASVIKIFDWLTEQLGLETFRELFPLILTDNGMEFQNPESLEYNSYGDKRTQIYYCNPHSSWQKGMLEKNHQYIRLVIPKGKALDKYSPQQITLLMNHINSEARDSLNTCTPFQLSKLLLNNKLHTVMNLKAIPPDEVTLIPNLLR